MFVEPLWVTVRRRDATEQYRPVVAGGTMMVSREAFGAVGGFRDTRKYVDANLFRAVRAAGGTIYRSHGLNYLLRTAGRRVTPGNPGWATSSVVGDPGSSGGASGRVPCSSPTLLTGLHGRRARSPRDEQASRAAPGPGERVALAPAAGDRRLGATL